MTDGQTLLLVLALLYLTECVIWVKKQSVAFVSPWGRRWRVASLNSSLGNARGGLLFVNPLPPLGRVFLSHLSPISISPVGICAFNLQALPAVGRPLQTGLSLTFKEITGSSNDGEYLLVNGERFIKCATTTQARAISQLINAATNASASDREEIVTAYIAKQFAADQANALLQEAQLMIKPIRSMCSLLFLVLFVATPILASILGLLPVLIPVAIVMIVCAVDISIMFYRAHKKLYPHESQKRIEGVVKMVLCPPVSIRAPDLLTKHLLADYSPVVVAAVLSGSATQQFVRAFMLDLRHPLKHDVSDAACVETITWAAAEQLRFSLDYIKRSGYSSPPVLLAPPQSDGTSMSYCPRCGGQFVVPSGACPDCPGVGLLAFVEPNEAETRGAV